MKIFGIELSSKKRKESKLKQVPAADKVKPIVDKVKIPISNKINIVKIPRIKNPTLSFKPRPGADVFEQPEYDLAEVGRIEDVESYVRRAFRYKEGLMFKESWEIVGSNTKAINYIKERFRQMDQATGLPTQLLIRGVGADLVRFSNAYLVKVRKTEASGGQVRSVPGRDTKLEPVAGYFAIPPTTVNLMRDEHGKIKAYRQMLPTGKHVDFSPDNVIHFYFDRKKGFLVGTPSLTPVKDDIRCLRRIEENVELLVYQHLFPLFHYKVGTEKAPSKTYTDGTREIDAVKTEIELMPAEGALVTPERHEIKAIGVEGRALRIESYLAHFKQRVFAGLGVSAIDMGEGDSANRSCYSGDTETLTDSGFKKYWEITDNDKIATYNPKTNQLDFHSPNGSMLLYDYKGEMYHFENRNVDVLVTPDHDMWMGRPLWNVLKWGKIHAEDIDIQNYKFLSGGLKWDGTEPGDFQLPYVAYAHWINHANSGLFPRIAIEDWLEFLGYYVSEGCLAKAKNKWAITISQNSLVNSDKAKKIRECLSRLPFEFKEYTDPNDRTTRFWINCKSLYLYLQDQCKDYSYIKQLPADVLNYSSRLLRIVFESMMLGDGTTDMRQGRTSRTYYSTSEVLIDQVQEIAIKLGYRANVLPGPGCQRVCMSKHVVANVTSDQVDIVEYDGKVYCFNVPNHLFITRRNGRIGIHGNTADNMSRNMVDDVKAMQRDLELFLNEYIIKELLLESTFPNPLDEENLVKFKFREIDLEAQIKVQNHYIEAYGGHAITHPELRAHFGKEPFTETDEELSFWKRVEEPRLLIQAIDEPYSAEAKAAAKSAATGIEQGDLDSEAAERKKEIALEAKAKASNQKTGPKVTKKSSGQRAAAAKNRPSNQHGRKSGSEKRKSEFAGITFRDMVGRGNRITALFDDLLDDSLRAAELYYFDGNWFNSTAEAASTLMKESLFSAVRLRFRTGFQKTGIICNYEDEVYPLNVLRSRTDSIVDRFMKRLIARLKLSLSFNDDIDDKKFKLIKIFDALRFRSRFIYNSELNKATNYGLALGLKKLGHMEAHVYIHASACDICKNHSTIVSLEHVLVSDLPGYHPNCECYLMAK